MSFDPGADLVCAKEDVSDGHAPCKSEFQAYQSSSGDPLVEDMDGIFQHYGSEHSLEDLASKVSKDQCCSSHSSEASAINVLFLDNYGCGKHSAGQICLSSG